MNDSNSSGREVIEEFRRNGGKVSGYFEGETILLLHTIGRRSGKRCTTPVAYERDGDRLILIAANVGATKIPDWYYNLVDHPEVVVEIGRETFSARASIVEREEQERFLTDARASWAEAKKSRPQLPDWPLRPIPVIALVFSQ